MVKMGARAGHREAGDRGALASRWLSVVLGLPFSPPSWPAEKSPPNFRNSSALWQRRNPTWGAPRTHGELLKLGFEISECTVSRYLDRNEPSSRFRQALVNLSQEPSGDDCYDGFLYRADGDLPRALLLLRDQPQRAENPALQRHGTSHQSVDRAATVERFSWRIGHLSTRSSIVMGSSAETSRECWKLS